MIEKITPKQEVDAEQSTETAKQGEEQKETQVADQKAAKADQDKAKEKSALADAKAATDKANKELAKIPQKIEEALDDAIEAMEKALGWQPKVKKVTIIKKNGEKKEVPDFDPDEVLKDIKKIIDPVLDALSPVESVVGKIPVVGDIISVLTKLGTQEFPGESEISMKDIRELVPTPPDFPPSIMQKAKLLLQLVQQFLMMLPIILIDVIFQMLCAIYDMFDQIVGILGVPPPIFPFNLVKQMPTLMPKVKTLMQQLPTQVDTLVVEKLKQKYQVAMALQIPKPNLGDAAADDKNDASNATSSGQAPSTGGNTSSSSSAGAKKDEESMKETVPETPVAPSQPAPATSNIPETPSIKPIEPKPPVAPPNEEYAFINIEITPDGTACGPFTIWNLNQINSPSDQIRLKNWCSDKIKTLSIDGGKIMPSSGGLRARYKFMQPVKADYGKKLALKIIDGWQSLTRITHDGNDIKVRRTYEIEMDSDDDNLQIDVTLNQEMFKITMKNGEEQCEEYEPDDEQWMYAPNNS